MVKEFRDFIITGNVIEFAVAVIMAGAVGQVVNGFVTDIIMPIIGQFFGGMDFSQMKYVLSPAITDATGAIVKPENAILYGAWINTIINLIVVGMVMFAIVKAYNKVRKNQAAAGPTEIDLLVEIRDSLKK